MNHSNGTYCSRWEGAYTKGNVFYGKSMTRPSHTYGQNSLIGLFGLTLWFCGCSCLIQKIFKELFGMMNSWNRQILSETLLNLITNPTSKLGLQYLHCFIWDEQSLYCFEDQHCARDFIFLLSTRIQHSSVYFPVHKSSLLKAL